MVKVLFQIGDRQIHAVVHQHQRATPTMLNVHEDETTSVTAGKANLEEFGGRLIELVHSGERLITFSIAGKKYSFDPNRIFSDAGIVATLQKHSTYSADAHAAIKAFAGAYLRQFELNKEPLIVALHNTADGIFSVESFLPSGSLGNDAASVHVSPKRSKFDFFYVTEKHFFNYFKTQDFNVVLQDNFRVTEDGSLSVYFAQEGIPYINIEAEIQHLEVQIEMLRAVREMLGVPSSGFRVPG